VKQNGDRIVLLATARDELEAGIWRDVLERDSIAVYIKSGDPMSSFGMPPAPGSIRLFVQAADEKRARWLLGESIRSA
jgi:Putative prokaryotic signal transducing protein